MTQEEIMSLFRNMAVTSLDTLKIFSLTLLFSLPLGLLLCVGRMSKCIVISLPIRFFLLVMRGTPLILQLFAWYFGTAYLLPIKFTRFTAAIIAMSLNYAAYFAEIYRSGLESIPKGQREAAFVVGLTKSQTFFRITLPQVIKRILPPMGSECMTLVKDTALVSVISVPEIYKMATESMTTQLSVIPIIMAGVFYLVMNSIIALTFHITEKRLSYYH